MKIIIIILLLIFFFHESILELEINITLLDSDKAKLQQLVSS